MALHKDFPQSPHTILDPGIRWFPADEALRESSMEKVMPPLVPVLRRKVKEFRDGGYVGAADTIFGNDTMTIVEVSVGGGRNNGEEKRGQIKGTVL